MSKQEAIMVLMSAYGYLVRDKSFWSDRALIDASHILYVAAADLLREEQGRTA